MLNFLLVNTLYYCTLDYLGKNILIPKITNTYKRIIIIGLFAILTTLISHATIAIEISLLSFLLYIFYIIIFYRGNLRIKVLVFLILLITLTGSELFTNFLLSLFTDLSYLNNHDSILFFLISFMSGTCSILLAFFLMKVLKELKNAELPNSTFLIFLLPIATLFLLFNYSDYSNMIKNNISLTISLIALIIANFISIHIFIKAINTTKKLSAIKAKNEMIDFRNKYLNQLYDSNFSFMHSTIRTLLKIQNHLEEKNYEQFQSELLNLNHHILTNFNVINSSSAIISTIINSNLKRIKENKIDFKSVLEFNDFSFLGLQDQQEIFELLLNIGFSSCSKSQSNSKIVILKTALKNNQIFIQLLFTNGNNSNPPIFQDDLCKIYKIINKYNGTLTLDENFDKDGSSILVLLPYTSACPC